jgi:hypothetical protein
MKNIYPCIVLIALHSVASPEKTRKFAAEIQTFEQETGRTGKAAYVSEQIHPFERAFLANDIDMLEYFYEHALLAEQKRHQARSSSRFSGLRAWAKRNPLDPEFPAFDYKDKLLFGIMIEHAKKPACHPGGAPGRAFKCALFTLPFSQ